MKKMLLLLFGLVLSAKSFGQTTPTASFRYAYTNSGTYSDYISMTKNDDGTFTATVTLEDQGYYKWLVSYNDGTGAVTYPQNAWHTSWVYTTSSNESVTFKFDPNEYNDGWLPASNIVSSNESWGTKSITATVNDGSNHYVNMVDDGSTMGDWAKGDNIFSGKYTTSASVGTDVTISMRFSAYTYAGSNSAYYTKYGKTQSNLGSDRNSITTTKTPQDIYFYVNMNTGRTRVTLDSPLPVELASFTAELIDGAVVLHWVTATEVNNYGFDIESSNDNVNWNVIGFVKGHGNSNSPNNYSFVANDGATYYRLKQIDTDGAYVYSEVVEISSNLSYKLSQNYPNPFNPTTVIKFSLPKSGITTLEVFNILGEKVATLVDKKLSAGNYAFDFNAKNLPSGIYIYRLEANNFSAVRKMLLLK